MNPRFVFITGGESLLAFKRAGADGVVTYFALEAARLIKAAK